MLWQLKSRGGAGESDHSLRRLHTLDGLRFAAAFLVAGGHYLTVFIDPVPHLLSTFVGLGMTLFFVLSGFVIHYTYHSSLGDPGGTGRFLVARFARLYPLFGLLLAAELTYVFAAHRGAWGLADDRSSLSWALPYYLTLTQAWFFSITCHSSLIYQYVPCQL